MCPALLIFTWGASVIFGKGAAEGTGGGITDRQSNRINGGIFLLKQLHGLIHAKFQNQIRKCQTGATVHDTADLPVAVMEMLCNAFYGYRCKIGLNVCQYSGEFVFPEKVGSSRQTGGTLVPAQQKHEECTHEGIEHLRAVPFRPSVLLIDTVKQQRDVLIIAGFKVQIGSSINTKIPSILRSPA